MIFLFLMTSGISVYFLSIESQTSMIETQEIINNLQTRKTQENYDVSISTDVEDNNRLAIQIKNNGHFPLEIADFWIINKTDAVNEFPVKRFEVNFTEPYIPPGYGANILENYPLYMNPDTYNVKVVSTLGTIHQNEIIVGGANNLRAELFAIPTDVKVGHNATIALHVTNVGNTRLLNVQPNNVTINPTGGVAPPLPPLPGSVTLDPAESIIFAWNYQMAGTPGNNVMFTTNVTASEDITGFNVTSNNASDEITLREPDVEELIVLTQDLISRPEIFLTIPSPFGDSVDKGLWGINIVNPTAQPMNVTKVVLSILNPRSTPADIVFHSITCGITGLEPSIGTWSCPETNQIMWKSTTEALQVDAFSVSPLFAKVQPGNLGSNVELETIIVNTNVFTTVGEFGKPGYGSSMAWTDQPIVNVYLAKDTESTSDSDIYTNMTGISSNSTITLNATIADFSSTSNDAIQEGKLIINIPKGWTFEQTLSNTGFNTPVLQTFPDSSSQLIAELASSFNSGAKTVQFEVTAPEVTSTQMYVMYILAEGKTDNNDFSLGPISEVVLQVVP